MPEVNVSTKVTVEKLDGALGAVVRGLRVSDYSDADLRELADSLLPWWDERLVLFFPGVHFSPSDQSRLAHCFGSHVAATTETAADNRNIPTLRDEGFPEILLIDSHTPGFNPYVTAVWHTDVPFIEHPPKASLFYCEIAAVGAGDTMWNNQIAAYRRLSPPMQRMIDDLDVVMGAPPQTTTHVHPMVRRHHASGEKSIFANRGWTRNIVGMSEAESRHVLEAVYAVSERPENVVRWKWTSGDGALWDNRYTMHYAVADYGSQHRRVRRATIYD
ncbi:MAG: TauD/TfdA dioxygenase family protein [Actinomycetota bacterium]